MADVRLPLSDVGGANFDMGDSTAPAAKPAEKKSKSLSARWLFDAALMSSPIDLSALVTLSQKNPAAIVKEVGLLNRMVEVCLNSGKNKRVDKDTRLDVLQVLGNIARTDDAAVLAHVQKVLGGVSEWFDEYLRAEESGGREDGDASDEDAAAPPPEKEPELHKAMLVLLCRAYAYGLKTDDVLELCGGDRALALETVVGLLEDGETLVTEVAQKRAPGEDGGRAVWEQQTVAQAYEKPLIVQVCRLLRGFTHPDTYFQATEDGFYYLEAGVELPARSVDEARAEHGFFFQFAVGSF
jgi:hypothetical protein